MWPFELVATATDSPRYSPGGSFKKFGTDENSISGTCSIVALRWANVGAVARVARTTDDGRIHFMETSPNVPIGITILTEPEEGYDTVPALRSSLRHKACIRPLYAKNAVLQCRPKEGADYGFDQTEHTDKWRSGDCNGRNTAPVCSTDW